MNGRKMDRGGGQCEAAKHEVGCGAGEPGGARPEAGKKRLHLRRLGLILALTV